MDSRGHRATCWSVTCNLKTVSRTSVDSCIESARSLGWGVEGQLERGAEGTEHYQLMVKTPQVRFSALKRIFPTAHIEPARNRSALEQYVHKEDSRVEALKTIEVSFLTYPMVRNKFFEWLLERDIEAFTNDYERRLQLWDEFIGDSIAEGMEVDLIGMNPQHRGCVSKYWNSYIARTSRHRQTDDRRQTRQTDIQEVSVPMYT